MKLLLSGLIGLCLAASAFAAHIGDTITATVQVEDRVPIVQQAEPQEVTHITVDSGVWLISAQVSILSLSQPAGTLFTAAQISVGELSFSPAATASIVAERVAGVGNIIRPMALTPREFEVEDGTQVFLVTSVFNPNNGVTAWGFITAVKVRNHVP
jgi:hypothetical protein